MSHRAFQAIGLASCPLSYLVSTLLFGHTIDRAQQVALLALSGAWLALELYVGAARPSAGRLPNPRWVHITRGLWLLGPWLCWIDRAQGWTRLVLPPWVAAAALVAGGLGLALRGAAIVQLGRRFTLAMEPGPGHALCTAGAYRALRHPAYAGLLLLTNLLGPVTGSAAGALLLASTVPNVVQRIAQEEAALIRTFGERYRSYRRRSWRLLPFLY